MISATFAQSTRVAIEIIKIILGYQLSKKNSHEMIRKSFTRKVTKIRTHRLGYLENRQALFEIKRLTATTEIIENATKNIFGFFIMLATYLR